MAAVLPPLAEHMVLSTQPSEEYLGPYGGKTEFVKNKHGLNICRYFWPVPPDVTPRGIVVLAHGHGCYLAFDYLRPQGPGKFCVYSGSFVAALNAAGYAVAGNDDRGAGRSEGLRCYCDSFDDYVEDLVATARASREVPLRGFSAPAPAGAPLFAMGLSRGGAVVLTAALKEPSLFSGCICLAPMVSLEKVARQGLNPYLRPLGRLLSWLMPEVALLSTNRNTKFPDLQEAYDVDPNCYHKNTRVRTAQEYLRATEWLAAHTGELSLPLLLFHSEGDTQTDPEGTKRLYALAQSKDKTFVAPEGMWHIILKEPGNDKVKAQVLQWLDEHTTPKAT
ncbi:hypothetical protein CHLRE_12g504350v5 [Chlamydomonas reinhardtii]|uniref:Serine aminopeptidase S33 domain-containing protein n=1 Tax=Chlamydomonas reinhardtii TaxID=3055 RepID=A0A2K3D322_CHLRE|nr:uncharacterized protein CHLRE_12g504350v5 [Chlamydomonas reinhardtii]PNW74921.1 hypothetical protein CHLRE_12g504350v5 [Chlamydomonas reinhardtii]